MRAIVRVCTQRLPNRLLSSVKKDSTTSWRSQIFMSVVALEYLGKVEDTDQSGARRIYSHLVVVKQLKEERRYEWLLDDRYCSAGLRVGENTKGIR